MIAKFLEFNEQSFPWAPGVSIPKSFFHRCATGMYHLWAAPVISPRQPFQGIRADGLSHFGYAPWNVHMIKRKTQILDKLSTRELRFGWGVHHVKTRRKSIETLKSFALMQLDLKLHPHAKSNVSSCISYIRIMMPLKRQRRIFYTTTLPIRTSRSP